MAWGFEKDYHFMPPPEKPTSSVSAHFERDLRERWDQLTASFPPAQFTSRIAVPHPVVVPGGRFNESYYWDSYWIVEGFVPNGTRIYYTTRSQPPMLAEMVLAILSRG